MNRSTLLIILTFLSAAFAYAGGPVIPSGSTAGLGTMAMEDKSDYVATSTLAAHEVDTSTHGKSTIAGLEDVDDLSGVTDPTAARSKLGVPATSATVLTSGVNPMTGRLILDPGRQNSAGAFAASHLVLSHSSYVGDYAQLTFGYTVGTTYGSAYIGFLGTNQGGNGYGDLVFGTRAVNTDTQPTERARLTSIGTVLVATATDNVAYKVIVDGSVYVSGDVGCDNVVDHSDSPDDLASAYAIVSSHETVGGKVDHSKLSPMAYSKRIVAKPTGKKIMVPVARLGTLKEGLIKTTELVDELEYVTESDSSGRNLSMVVSAQALVIKDLTDRIAALEAK